MLLVVGGGNEHFGDARTNCGDRSVVGSDGASDGERDNGSFAASDVVPDVRTGSGLSCRWATTPYRDEGVGGVAVMLSNSSLIQSASSSMSSERTTTKQSQYLHSRHTHYGLSQRRRGEKVINNDLLFC